MAHVLVRSPPTVLCIVGIGEKEMLRDDSGHPSENIQPDLPT